MSGVKAHKDKQIKDINEVMVEIREAYNKIQEKISQLKETSFKDTIEKYSEEADSILETLNQTDKDLQTKSLKEIETIKNRMLVQYDKATNLQHELKRIYTKEAFIRQYSIDEECNTSKFLDRSVNYDAENTSVRSKHTPNQNYLDSPQMENYRYESEGQKRYRPSYCTSDFSDKIIHEFNEHSDDQEEGSFEDYKAYRNTIKNKRIARHQVSQSVQFSRVPNGEFFKEPSDYEYIFSKKGKVETINNAASTRKEHPYIEKIWNLHGTFGKIASPKKSIEASNQSQQGSFFKSSKALLQFLDESEDRQRDYLWQYVFFLQDRLQADAEYHQREMAELKEVIAYKDETIKQLLKKQEKHDINAETKYYENLKYVHNPKKMISQMKSDRHANRYQNHNTSFQDENILTRNPAQNQGQYASSRRGYDSNPISDHASLTKKSFSNFDAHHKTPLTNVSINQSYDYHNNENTFSSKTHRNQHEGYSTLNTLQSEDDLIFSTNMNQRAYIQNLQETLTAMKENSILVQSENDKLKEYVKLLRNKVMMFEREKEQNVSKQNISHVSQAKGHNRTYTQVSQSTSNLGFKWTDPSKFLELEKRNKAALNSYRYNKSISYTPQDAES